MTNDRLRAGLANLLLALAASVVALGVAELSVRAFAPVGLDGPSELRVPHPLLGWQGEPGGSFAYSVSERERIVVRYNSVGLRDVEHALEKPPNARRIVVLGDSFMEAHSVRLEDAFARQLEGLLRAEQPNAEVINLGVGGYGTLQEALIFRELGRRYAPDLVLLGFHVDNDLRDNSWRLQETAGEGRYLKRRSRPYLDASALPGWRVLPPDFASSERAYRARRESIETRLARRSALVDASERALGNARESWLGNPLRRFFGGDAAVDRVLLAEHGEHYCVEPPEFSEAWDITRAVLQRLEADVAAAGSQLIVFSVPSLEEVDPARADDGAYVARRAARLPRASASGLRAPRHDAP